MRGKRRREVGGKRRSEGGWGGGIFFLSTSSKNDDDTLSISVTSSSNYHGLAKRRVTAVAQVVCGRVIEIISVKVKEIPRDAIANFLFPVVLWLHFLAS